MSKLKRPEIEIVFGQHGEVAIQVNGEGGGWWNLDCARQFREEINLAIQGVLNRRASPWVAVSERLPEPDFVGGLMFTTVPPDELHFGDWCDPVDWGDESGFCCRHECCGGKVYKVSEVSYWAPEPELPEEGQP